MNGEFRHKGSVLLLAIFVIALLSAVTIGMLQLSTEELQLMRNQIYARPLTAARTQLLSQARQLHRRALHRRALSDEWKPT
jgi:hypothetical protein